ncbi:MAG: hypothetical protein HS129_05760 [Leptospiraceae bacterium]|nr:hypothetical protein [Leptospiraceae bacterium]
MKINHKRVYRIMHENLFKMQSEEGLSSCDHGFKNIT